MDAFRTVRNPALALAGLTLVACGPVAIGAAIGSGGGGSTTELRVVETVITAGPSEGSFINTSNFTITYASPTATRFQWRLRPQDPWSESTATSITANAADGPIAFEVRGAEDAGQFGAIARRNFGIDTVAPGMATVDATERTDIGEVTLGWDVVADNNGGSGLRRYLVRFGSSQANLGNPVTIDANSSSGNRITTALTNLQLCATLTARVDVEDNAGNIATGMPFTIRTNCGADGTFSELAAVSFAAGETVTAIAYGDFNGDGLIDAFVGLATPGGGGRIAILRNEGASGFATVASGGAPTSSPVRDMALTDLDRDGILDIVAAYGTTLEVLVGSGIRQNGNNNALYATLSTRQFASPIATVDVGTFNSDGVPDFVVVEDVSPTSRRVTAILGQANGLLNTTFATVAPFDFADAVVFDADNDGLSDVITTGASTDVRSSSGNLQTPVSIGGAGILLATADVDRDGRIDILLGEASPDNGIRLLRNIGNASFADIGRRPLGGSLQAILAGDLNGDKLVDPVGLSNGSLDLIPVVEAAGSVSLAPPQQVGSANATSGFALDFDRDQITDFVIVDGDSQRIRVFKGNGVIGVGDGTFATFRDIDVGTTSPFSLALTDLNGDRIPDIGATSQNPNLYLQYRNTGSRGQGDGTFTEEAQIATNSKTQALVTGDLNGDGAADVLVVEFNSTTQVGGLRVLLGNGDGTYSSSTIALDVEPRDCVITDYNRDGKPDVVVNHFNPGLLTFLTNTGNPSAPLPSPPHATLSLPAARILAMTSGDFDEDGDPDLAIADINQGTYAIVTNTTGLPAGFSIGPWHPTSSAIPAADRRPSSLVAADFTGDGVLDLAIANGNQARPDPAAINASLAILPGQTTGMGQANATFGSPIEKIITPATAPSPWIITAGDVNGDRILDIASVSLDAPAGANQRVIVLIGQQASPGRGNGMFDNPAAFDLGSTTPRFDVEIADMDGDGIKDLVTSGGGRLEFLPGVGQ